MRLAENYYYLKIFLFQKLEILTDELERVHAKREEQILPLRDRGVELKEKLKLVESQLESTALSNRSFSRLDLRAGNQQIEDYSPSSPPPYFP